MAVPVAGTGAVLAMTQTAHAALPQLFPVGENMVPLVVAAAFAGLVSTLRRRRAISSLLGLTALVGAIVALAAIADPSLRAAIGIGA